MSDLGLKDTAALQGELNTRQDILSIDNIFRVTVSSSSPQFVKSIISPPSLKNPWNMGLGAYLDLALIFLLFRFSLLILFFLHLALIALAHFSCRSESSNKSLPSSSSFASASSSSSSSTW